MRYMNGPRAWMSGDAPTVPENNNTNNNANASNNRFSFEAWEVNKFQATGLAKRTGPPCYEQMSKRKSPCCDFPANTP